MGRRASREIAMKLLYQLELQKEDRQEQIDLVLEREELDSKDRQYIKDIVDGVNNNTEKIDKIIEVCLKGWKIERISKIELSILRLGIYEIKYREDIPFNVTINEAVELAKKYSGQEAGSFVNGLLGKAVSVEI